MRTYCIFAFYVVTPDTALESRTVCKHSVLCVNHEYHIIYVQLFQSDCRSFTSRKLYVCLKTFLCFLDQSDRAHSKEKLQLITIMRCSTSTIEIWLTFHISTGYNGNNITTTVNCLETDLPNLYINDGIDTIRTFSPKATVKHRVYWWSQCNKAQRDKLPVYRGPLPDVLNCHSSMWPDQTRVFPRSPQGVLRWETLGTRL